MKDFTNIIYELDVPRLYYSSVSGYIIWSPVFTFQKLTPRKGSHV